MTPLEMMEELRQRREYDKEHETRLEELGERVEEQERDLSILRVLLARQIIGIMLGPPVKMND